jgi:hypothetical protein
MEQLQNQQAVLNFIGKRTILKFSCLVDNIAEFESVVPKTLNEEYYNLRVSIFYDGGQDLLCYEEGEYLIDINRFQVFELWITNLGGEKECIYHRKYVDPKSN